MNYPNRKLSTALQMTAWGMLVPAILMFLAVLVAALGAPALSLFFMFLTLGAVVVYFVGLYKAGGSTASPKARSGFRNMATYQLVAAGIILVLYIVIIVTAVSSAVSTATRYADDYSYSKYEHSNSYEVELLSDLEDEYGYEYSDDYDDYDSYNDYDSDYDYTPRRSSLSSGNPFEALGEVFSTLGTVAKLCMVFMMSIGLILPILLRRQALRVKGAINLNGMGTVASGYLIMTIAQALNLISSILLMLAIGGASFSTMVTLLSVTTILGFVCFFLLFVSAIVIVVGWFQAASHASKGGGHAHLGSHQYYGNTAQSQEQPAFQPAQSYTQPAPTAAPVSPAAPAVSDATQIAPQPPTPNYQGYTDQALLDILNNAGRYDAATLEQVSIVLYNRPDSLLWQQVKSLPAEKLHEIVNNPSQYFPGYIHAAKDILSTQQ